MRGVHTHRAAAAVVSAVVGVLLLPAVAGADPTIPSAQDVARAQAQVGSVSGRVAQLQGQLAAAEAQLEQLGVAVGKAAEAYDGAVYQLGRARAAAARAERTAAQAQTDLASARRDMGVIAASAYKEGGSFGDLSALLMGGTDPLGAASTVQVLAGRQDAVVDRVRTQQVVTQVLSGQAADALQAVQQAAQAAQVAKQQVEAKVAEQQSKVGALTALKTQLTRQLRAAEANAGQLARARSDGLARLARERAAAAKAAAEARARAAEQARAARDASNGPGGTSSGGGSGSTGGTGSGGTGSGGSGGTSHGTSAGAARAVAFARAQLGEPYVWAAAGPDSWDCSGLTMMAWRAGGVSLAHWTVAQYEETRPVSRSEARPGDLVFFGSNRGDPSTIYHVGLYIGGGQMIEAPYTGAVVRISSVDRSSLYGFGRP